MTTVAINLDDIQESKPVAAGRYGLTIASAEEAVSQKGLPQIKVSIGIDGHDDAPNVTHYVSLPSAQDEPDKAKAKGLFLKRFLVAFNIPHSANGFDVNSFPGATADLELSLSEPDDSGNVYNRLQLPRLKTEGAGSASKAVAKPPKK